MTRLLLIAVASVALVAPASAQSLGQAAAASQKAREEAAARTGTPIWIPSLGISSARPTPAPAPAPAAEASSKRAASEPAAGSTATDTKPAAKNEAYWKDRMRKLQAEQDDARARVSGAESRAKAFDGDSQTFSSRGGPTAAYDRERTQARNELSRLQVELANATRAINDLEEEARRASVPPGWLRP